MEETFDMKFDAMWFQLAGGSPYAMLLHLGCTKDQLRSWARTMATDLAGKMRDQASDLTLQAATVEKQIQTAVAADLKAST